MGCIPQIILHLWGFLCVRDTGHSTQQPILQNQTWLRKVNNTIMSREGGWGGVGGRVQLNSYARCLGFYGFWEHSAPLILPSPLLRILHTYRGNSYILRKQGIQKKTQHMQSDTLCQKISDLLIMISNWKKSKSTTETSETLVKKYPTV